MGTIVTISLSHHLYNGINSRAGCGDCLQPIPMFKHSHFPLFFQFSYSVQILLLVSLVREKPTRRSSDQSILLAHPCRVNSMYPRLYWLSHIILINRFKVYVNKLTHAQTCTGNLCLRFRLVMHWLIARGCSTSDHMVAITHFGTYPPTQPPNHPTTYIHTWIQGIYKQYKHTNTHL